MKLHGCSDRAWRVAAATLVLCACKDSSNARVSIEVAPTDLTMAVGESAMVTMTVTAQELREDSDSVRVSPQAVSRDDAVVPSPDGVDFDPQQVDLAEGASGSMTVSLTCASAGQTIVDFGARDGVEPLDQGFVDGAMVSVTCTGGETGSTTDPTSTTGTDTTDGDSSGTTGGPPGCAADPQTVGPITVSGTTIDVNVDAANCGVVCSFDVMNGHTADVFATYAPFTPADPIKLLQRGAGNNGGTIATMATQTYDVEVSNCTASMMQTFNLQFFDDANMMMWEVPVTVVTTAQ